MFALKSCTLCIAQCIVLLHIGKLCPSNAAQSIKNVSYKILSSAVNCVGIWSRADESVEAEEVGGVGGGGGGQARPQGTRSCREAAALPTFAAAAPNCSCSCSSCIRGGGRRYGWDANSRFYASAPYLPKTSPTSLLHH